MSDSARIWSERAVLLDGTEGLLDTRRRLQLAEMLRELAGVTRLIHPPRDWADRAGYEVAVVHEDFVAQVLVDEAADDRTIAYVWARDPRERGIRIYCAMARRFLRNSMVEHTWHDVRRFALELAVPMATHRTGWERLCRSQMDCPVDIIRDVLRGRWG
jgi:hypothetical protein